ncbi:MAG TPA: pyridoxamine 5'-phosphate oxidase [Jatrophihabitans sp.]
MSEDRPGRPVDELATTRHSYDAGELTETSLAGHWLEQLQRWYDEAAARNDIPEPNAMQIATVDEQGRPDLRTVLARGFDDRGVVFYTNYNSAKGGQLARTPLAAGLFAWLPLARQVRFRGPVERVSEAESAAYFASRPRGAQLAAWASPQSEVIAGRDQLDELLDGIIRRFGEDAETGAPVPVPPFWGGYRITVTEMEFWQGREFRLHDRLRFRQDGADWVVERLAP